MSLTETLDRVVYFEGHIHSIFHIADSVFKHFFDLVLLVLSLIDILRGLVAALAQKLDDILQADVARSV